MTAPRSTPRILGAVAACLALGLLAACGDDDDGPADESPATSTASGEGTVEVLDSTGGPSGTVLNNQPTSPAVNNAPPGDDGTG